MKIKNNLKNNIFNISFKTILLIVFLTILFTQYVFAEENLFTIQIPEGYESLKEEGTIKLVVLRNDGKVTFNIQVIEADVHYEYSEEGLNELIEGSTKETDSYSIDFLDGKIDTVNEYPCYDLSYITTSAEDNTKMYIRQIYVFEDKHSYIITIGAENKQLLNSEEINKSMETFVIKDYKRDEALGNKKAKENVLNIVIIIAGSVLLLIVVIVVIVKKSKNKDNNKDKDKDKDKDKNMDTDKKETIETKKNTETDKEIK